MKTCWKLRLGCGLMLMPVVTSQADAVGQPLLGPMCMYMCMSICIIRLSSLDQYVYMQSDRMLSSLSDAQAPSLTLSFFRGILAKLEVGQTNLMKKRVCGDVFNIYPGITVTVT